MEQTRNAGLKCAQGVLELVTEVALAHELDVVGLVEKSGLQNQLRVGAVVDLGNEFQAPCAAQIQLDESQLQISGIPMVSALGEGIGVLSLGTRHADVASCFSTCPPAGLSSACRLELSRSMVWSHATTYSPYSEIAVLEHRLIISLSTSDSRPGCTGGIDHA